MSKCYYKENLLPLFSFKRRKFIVKFLNFTESSDFVGLDPINFIDWKAMGKKK